MIDQESLANRQHEIDHLLLIINQMAVRMNWRITYEPIVQGGVRVGVKAEIQPPMLITYTVRATQQVRGWRIECCGKVALTLQESAGAILLAMIQLVAYWEVAAITGEMN